MVRLPHGPGPTPTPPPKRAFRCVGRVHDASTTRPPQALPAEGDSLLYAVPVCAPYSALSARELGAELAAVESASSRRQL